MSKINQYDSKRQLNTTTTQILSGVGLGLKGWIIRASGKNNFELQN